VKKSEAWKSASQGTKLFVDLLNDRVWKYDKNAIVVFVGEPGSGKSYTAIRIATFINPNFNIDEHLVFTVEDFFKALDTAERGDVIIFDEAGVGIPAREWQSIQNKLFSYVLQTFRYKNVLVFMTTPNMIYLDKHARALVNYVVNVLGYNINDRKAMCVIYEKKHDPVRGSIQFDKWLYHDNGRYYDFNPCFVPAPDEELARRYEKISRQRKEEIRVNALEELKKLKDGLSINAKIDGRTIRRMKNITVAFYELYKFAKEEFGLSDRQIAMSIGVNNQSLHNWISWIETNLKFLKPEINNI